MDVFLNNKINKLSQQISNINLFDKNKSTYGYYVQYSSGNLVVNIPPYYYYASDYIRVDPDTSYELSRGEQHAWYDANKNYIYGSTGVALVKSPSTAYYIRVSCDATYIDSFYFRKYMNIDIFKLILPTVINVAVGRTIEIYNKQICWCGNIRNYSFYWECDIGKAYDRKFSVSATSGMVGNHTLTLKVYDNNMFLVTSGSITLKVVNKSTDIITPKKILAIGDSLTDISWWREEFKTLSDAMFGTDKITYIGTLGTSPYMHEGHSGWTTGSYLADTNYTYGGDIILTVSGVTVTPSIGKAYNVPDSSGSHQWTVKSTSISSGSGTITMRRVTNGTYTPNASGSITQVDTSGSGDSTIVFSAFSWVKGNAFWNRSTSQLDFANYLTENSLTQPDIVHILLGANDISAHSVLGTYDKIKGDFSTSISNLKTIVDKILSQWSGTKIYISMTPFWANQDGLGYQNGATNKFDSIERLRVFVFLDALNTQFKTYNANVSIVPVAQTMDSDYNYSSINVSPNPRSTLTIPMQTGDRHPGQDGFQQMADAIFSHFVEHYLDA